MGLHLTKNGHITTYDLSKPENYYSQRNNELDPHNTCATTSMIQALELLGYSFPTNIASKYKQPEDKLTFFIRNDKRVLNYYKEIDNYNYTKWANKEKDCYQPNEIHSVLSFGTNLFMDKEVTKFVPNFSIGDFVHEILVKQKPLVISAKFGNLNHIVTLVGCVVNYDNERTKFKSVNELDFFDIENFIIDDTYGNFKNDYKQGGGNNVLVSPTEIIELLKPLDNPLEKWCHVFV